MESSFSPSRPTGKAGWRWLKRAASRCNTRHFSPASGGSIPTAFRSCSGREFRTKNPAEIADRKEAAFRDIIRSNVPLAPGIESLLVKLKSRGAGMAVGSSAPPENVNLVLDAGHLRSWFDAVVDGTQVKQGKPAPDVFLRAAMLMDVPPARCAVIEDAPTGIQAAVAAGMLAVGVATTHRADELLAAGAAVCFPTLADVPLNTLMGE